MEKESLRDRIKKALLEDAGELFDLTNEFLKKGGNVEELEAVVEEALKEANNEEKLKRIAERARILFLAIWVASFRFATNK